MDLIGGELNIVQILRNYSFGLSREKNEEGTIGKDCRWFFGDVFAIFDQ